VEGRKRVYDGTPLLILQHLTPSQEVGAIVGAYPGVADANVYGVRLPNHDGRAGCCAIAFHEDHTPDLNAFSRHLHSILPRYAIPLFLRLTKAMTLTGNMKHQKHGLREEGIDPKKTRGEKIIWLKNGEYVDFTPDDWEGLQAGQVKL
jgi:acyl-CoA synthetase (AMP-forming)/AMP-acid ligase II